MEDFNFRRATDEEMSRIIKITRMFTIYLSVVKLK